MVVRESQTVEQTAYAAVRKRRKDIIKRIAFLGHIDELLQLCQSIPPVYKISEHMTRYTSKP